MFISVIQTTSAATCTVAIAVAVAVAALYLISITISLSRFDFSNMISTRRRRRRVVVEWQNLPTDVLFLIAERSEIRHLRAVCSLWRSSLPPLQYKAHHPLYSIKIPLPNSTQDQLRARPVPYYVGEYANPSLTERNIYCLEPLGNEYTGSPKSSWIVKLEETSSSSGIIMRKIYHPLSNWSIRASELNLPPVVDLLDCRVTLVGKEYKFRNNYFRCKVVLSDDAVLCLFNCQNLGYFKFGDERWTMIIDEGKGELSYTSGIMYHKQKFYVIDTNGRIIVFDSTLKVEVFVSPVGGEGHYGEWSFVHSERDLFVVNKYKVNTTFLDYHGNRVADEHDLLVQFKVYILNSDEQQWNQVTDLGDRSFFISDGCTFSLCAEQFPGCGKNFIYCADVTFQTVGGNAAEPGYDVGVFNLKDNSSKPLHMISGYSRLFWPIPSWLKQGCF